MLMYTNLVWIVDMQSFLISMLPRLSHSQNILHMMQSFMITGIWSCLMLSVIRVVCWQDDVIQKSLRKIMALPYLPAKHIQWKIVRNWEGMPPTPILLLIVHPLLRCRPLAPPPPPPRWRSAPPPPNKKIIIKIIKTQLRHWRCI